MPNTTESIWNACGNGLKSFILKRVSDPDIADDLLQEVFLKIHSKMDTLENESKICSWVYRIARNTIIDHYRKRKTGLIDIDSFQIGDDLEDDDKINHESFDESILPLLHEEKEQTAEQEIAAGLREMIESLPKKYAEALLLVEFDGISQIELADKLGISVAGAKSRVQRGRQILRDSLMRCCHFEFDKYGTIISSRPHCCRCK